MIGLYARDLGLFPIEVAIHKMTGLTARVFGLIDRGRLEKGCYADLVLFDLTRVIDRATYDAPIQQSAGIEQVYVNGTLSFTRDRGVIARTGRLVGKRMK